MLKNHRRELCPPEAAAHGRSRLTLLAAMLSGMLPAALVLSSTASAVSGPPAVYTDQQALEGRQAYYHTCAICHGEALEGKVGPALTGRQFHQMVAAQNMTAPSLFQVITTQMPKSKPGSLAPAEYAKIMAFILKQNGYPAGDSPLGDQGQGLEKINLAVAPKSNS